jgi:hypothetical protein
VPLPGKTPVAAGPQATLCQIVVVAVLVGAGAVVLCAVTEAQHLHADENWPAAGHSRVANVGTDVGTMLLSFPLPGYSEVVFRKVVTGGAEVTSVGMFVVYL